MSEKTEKFCTIRQRGGKFNFADPTQEQRIIRITLPRYDFNESFTYTKPFHIDVRGMPWHEALDEIITSDPFGIRANNTYLPELEGILNEHYGEIKKKWGEHRAGKIDEEIEQLEAEREALQ